MRLKAILCVVSVLLAFGCMGTSPFTSDFERKRGFDEEQKKIYQDSYDEDQKRQRGHLVIENFTSSTVYLVIDYATQIKIRPGRRVSRTIIAGNHILVAYDEDGYIINRTRIYVHPSDRSTWSIDE